MVIASSVSLRCFLGGSYAATPGIFIGLDQINIPIPIRWQDAAVYPFAVLGSKDTNSVTIHSK